MDSNYFRKRLDGLIGLDEVNLTIGWNRWGASNEIDRMKSMRSMMAWKVDEISTTYMTYVHFHEETINETLKRVTSDWIGSDSIWINSNRNMESHNTASGRIDWINRLDTNQLDGIDWDEVNRMKLIGQNPMEDWEHDDQRDVQTSWSLRINLWGDNAVANCSLVFVEFDKDLWRA